MQNNAYLRKDKTFPFIGYIGFIKFHFTYEINGSNKQTKI